MRRPLRTNVNTLFIAVQILRHVWCLSGKADSAFIFYFGAYFVNVHEMVDHYICQAEAFFGKMTSDWTYSGIESNDMPPHLLYFPETSSIVISLSELGVTKFRCASSSRMKFATCFIRH